MSIRDLYYSKRELAEELGVTIRTLDRWWAERVGPPRVYIGREPVYLRESARQWLERREQTAARDRAA